MGKFYELATKNYPIISEFALTNREKLTDFQGFVIEELSVEGFSKEDYIRFMNELNDDMFVANLLNCLTDENVVNMMQAVEDGKMTIDEFIKNSKAAYGLL